MFVTSAFMLSMPFLFSNFHFRHKIPRMIITSTGDIISRTFIFFLSLKSSVFHNALNNFKCFPPALLTKQLCKSKRNHLIYYVSKQTKSQDILSACFCFQYIKKTQKLIFALKQSVHKTFRAFNS